MALKDLLLYVDQSEHACMRLRLAVDLARIHTSRFIVLFVRDLNPPYSISRVLRNWAKAPPMRSSVRTDISDNRSMKEQSGYGFL